jgi:hypothetical protein
MQYVSCEVRTDFVSRLQWNMAKMFHLRGCSSEFSSFPLLRIEGPLTRCNRCRNCKFCYNLLTYTLTVFLWIKPTDALSSSFIGIMILHVSGSLSSHHQEFLAVHRHWYNLCSLVTECFHWWWAERLPETCRVVIPIKLGLSASVGFIHKESITMHGHTSLKNY